MQCAPDPYEFFQSIFGLRALSKCVLLTVHIWTCHLRGVNCSSIASASCHLPPHVALARPTTAVLVPVRLYYCSTSTAVLVYPDTAAATRNLGDLSDIKFRSIHILGLTVHARESRESEVRTTSRDKFATIIKFHSAVITAIAQRTISHICLCPVSEW